MSKPIVYSLFRFAMAVCFFGIAASVHAGDGKPVAVAEVDSYDFGLAYEGADVSHDFIIKNTGKADLVIQAVKTG
ncbi:MAG: DUF1573 domain-containing protein [Desulfosalsimonadaceae bacterium]